MTGGLAAEQMTVLRWLLEETFETGSLVSESDLENGVRDDGVSYDVVEIGPRLNFSTAWSTNAVSICHACGLHDIRRIERSVRYRIGTSTPLTPSDRTLFANAVRRHTLPRITPNLWSSGL